MAMDRDKAAVIDMVAKLLVDAFDLQGITLVVLDADGGHSIGAYKSTHSGARALARHLRACADRIDPDPDPWQTDVEQ